MGNGDFEIINLFHFDINGVKLREVANCFIQIKKNIKDLTFICKIAPDNMAILFIDNVKHTSIHHKYMIYTHVYSYMYRYSNTSVWTSFHDILLIPITKNIKNNDVNHKFNTLCLERCNRESLSLMSQTLYISKLGDKSGSHQ